MTIRTRNFKTRALMKAETIQQRNQGFRALHIDFIGNDERNGYRVTFDDTSFPRPTQREMTAGEFIDFLMNERDIIHKPSTLTRFRTLLRLN